MPRCLGSAAQCNTRPSVMSPKRWRGEAPLGHLVDGDVAATSVVAYAFLYTIPSDDVDSSYMASTWSSVCALVLLRWGFADYGDSEDAGYSLGMLSEDAMWSAWTSIITLLLCVCLQYRWRRLSVTSSGCTTTMRYCWQRQTDRDSLMVRPRAATSLLWRASDMLALNAYREQSCGNNICIASELSYPYANALNPESVCPLFPVLLGGGGELDSDSQRAFQSIRAGSLAGICDAKVTRTLLLANPTFASQYFNAGGDTEKLEIYVQALKGLGLLGLVNQTYVSNLRSTNVPRGRFRNRSRPPPNRDASGVTPPLVQGPAQSAISAGGEAGNVGRWGRRSQPTPVAQPPQQEIDMQQSGWKVIDRKRAKSLESDCLVDEWTAPVRCDLHFHMPGVAYTEDIDKAKLWMNT
eukprot:6458898-Amphidinium_carterae.1